MITRKQLTAMMINAIVVKMLITFPRALFEFCGNAAWMTMVYAPIVAFCLFWVTKKLYISEKSVIGKAEQLGGKWLKIVVGLLVFVVLSLNILSVVRIFPEIIRLVLLQSTFVEIIALAFIFVIILGALCGIDSIARVHEFFLPVAGIAFVAFLLMLIPNLNPENLFPIFGEGIYNITVKGSVSLAVFNDLLLLNVLIPYTKTSEIYAKAGMRAIITGGIYCFFVILFYAMSYAYPSSTKLIIPIYQLERVINLGDFFSRLESIFQFIWSISILLYTIMYVCVLSLVWKETFDLSHSKPLISPIIVFIAGIATIPVSLDKMIEIERIIAQWNFIPALLIPLIVAGIYGIVSHETF